MSRVYTPISLDGKDEYLARLRACPQKTSDYSFANLWGWREAYGLEWSFGQHMVWLRQTKPQIATWAPVGPWTEVDWSACPTLEAEPAEFTRVPESLAQVWAKAWPNRVELTEAREHWDYVYSIQELIKLSGNRFHKKKNLLSQFMKTYAYEYHPLSADCIEEVLQMQLEWCQWREAECDATLRLENQAITRVVKDWDSLPNLIGGAIRVDKRMVAYTVAEVLDQDMLVIHFEKGHTHYKGVYQAINQMFLENQGQDFKLVNREQDLGDEGLRKAKMSYNPTMFMKKYKVCSKP